MDNGPPLFGLEREVGFHYRFCVVGNPHRLKPLLIYLASNPLQQLGLAPNIFLIHRFSHFGNITIILCNGLRHTIVGAKLNSSDYLLRDVNSMTLA